MQRRSRLQSTNQVEHNCRRCSGVDGQPAHKLTFSKRDEERRRHGGTGTGSFPPSRTCQATRRIAGSRTRPAT